MRLRKEEKIYRKRKLAVTKSDVEKERKNKLKERNSCYLNQIWKRREKIYWKRENKSLQKSDFEKDRKI